MNFSKLFFVGSLLIIHISAVTGEVDQFSKRDVLIVDSADLLNLKTNLVIKKSIEDVNSKNKGCDEKALYKDLRKSFANHLKGKLLKDIISDTTFPKRHVSVKESVYNDWSIWDGLLMGFSVIFNKAIAMSDEIKIGDFEVGIDKLEHMFGQGFKYFTRNYLKGKGEVAVVERGIFLEKFIMGGNKMVNGVFSYADLSANFNGMRFWNHILQLREDAMGADYNIGPYIICENDKWKKAKDIDFRDYFDDSFNESINCSTFPTNSTLNKYKDRLNDLGTSCPIDQKRLDDVIIKYKDFSKWIINPDGTVINKK